MRQLLAAEAAGWFAAHRGGLTAGQHAEFATWLRASPRHIQEYIAVAGIARDLREACESLAEPIETLVARARSEEQQKVTPLWRGIRATLEEALAPPRWRQGVAAIALLTVAVIGVLLVARFDGEVSPANRTADAALELQTHPGERATFHLADGSTVHLSSASKAFVWMTPHDRRVELATGEAFFEVVHDSARPFRVTAGFAEVVDVGTQFDVRRNGANTVVTVVEGRVSVARAHAASFGAKAPRNESRREALLLGPNEQLTVDDGSWPATATTVDAGRTISWLQHKIVFENESLERVAAEFSRYSARPIEIAAPALRGLRISGSFSTDDPAAFVAFLGRLDGVKVDVTPTRIVVSQR